MARKSRDRAQEYRTLAEGYRLLVSPLARRYQMAAEVLEQVQSDPAGDERADAETPDRNAGSGQPARVQM